MKKIAIVMLVILIFIFSCKNVNILNPNENDVEVFYYSEYSYDFMELYEDIEDALEYRKQYIIKDYKDKFRSILVFNSDIYQFILIDNDYNKFRLHFYEDDNFSIRFNDKYIVNNSSYNYMDLQEDGFLTIYYDNNKLKIPFNYDVDEIKKYNYLSDEENSDVNFIIFTIKLYESLYTNNFLNY